MNDPLQKYLLTYFRYSVGQRMFEDRCLQLTEFSGSRDEIEQLKDETCRLAVYVSDSASDVEDCTKEVLDYLGSSPDRDDELLNDIAAALNTAVVDRECADEYTKAVTSRRLSGSARRPHRRKVANPFETFSDEGDSPFLIIPREEQPADEDGGAEKPVEEQPAEDESERTPAKEAAERDSSGDSDTDDGGETAGEEGGRPSETAQDADVPPVEPVADDAGGPSPGPQAVEEESSGDPPGKTVDVSDDAGGVPCTIQEESKHILEEDAKQKSDGEPEPQKRKKKRFTPRHKLGRLRCGKQYFRL